MKMYILGLEREFANGKDDIPELAVIDEDLVTFDGAGDPMNPKNWPKRKKWATTFIVALYVFLSPFASSILVSFTLYIFSYLGSCHFSSRRRIPRNQRYHIIIVSIRLCSCIRRGPSYNGTGIRTIWQVKALGVQLRANDKSYRSSRLDGFVLDFQHCLCCSTNHNAIGCFPLLFRARRRCSFGNWRRCARRYLGG